VKQKKRSRKKPFMKRKKFGLGNERPAKIDHPNVVIEDVFEGESTRIGKIF